MSRDYGKFFNWSATVRGLAMVAIACATLSVSRAQAQDQDQNQDDPPSRVARLGFMEGSISFQPAGESEWVPAAPNRPMTTGDKIWVDSESRAEVQLGSATLDLAQKTGFSFLNLDDHTIQIQLSAGSVNVRVWDLDRDNVFEIDTPNQAFTIHRRGRYRVDASEDGNYTVITVREGEGESTGNGQSYNLHEGQRTTFSGTTSLNADVEMIGEPDSFDRWSERREHRDQESPSAQYVSRQMVGYQDLDENGDWQPTPEYGAVWFPHVEAGWAPYHYGHWAWIEPWGWTWVDDAPWGYAPFHYGRWVNVYGRWGWIPGPREERPVYAPALVVFVGGSPAGGNVAWFPLGPREVFVPSYHVSEGYVNRVNVSNTNVSTTQVTNVYNTTIINNNTTVNNTTVNNTTVNNTRVNNITYANRNVQGAVTAVPQQAFASAQPVAKSAVPVNNHQFALAPVVTRAAVAPAPQAVLGAHVNPANNHVVMPPAAIANRPVIAKSTPPPPPPSFAVRQQVLAQHPGQPIAPRQMQQLRPANAPAPVMVKQAPPAKPAMPNASAANQPNSQPTPNNRPNGPAWNNRPDNRENRTPPPGHMDRPAAAQPVSQPQPAQSAPNNNRPEANRPEPPRNDRPAAAQPAPAPAANNSHAAPEPAHNDHQMAQPNYHPAAPAQNQPASHPQNAPAAQSHPAPAPQQHSQPDNKHQDHKDQH